MDTVSQLASVAELIQAGGIIVLMVVMVGAFYYRKILPESTHKEILDVQANAMNLVVDKVVEKFDQQDANFEGFAKEVGELAEDYYQWQGEWKKALDKQTDLLVSIDAELKKVNGNM